MKLLHKVSTKIFLIFISFLLVICSLLTLAVRNFTYQSMVEQTRVNDLRTIDMLSSAVDGELTKLRLSGEIVQSSAPLLDYMKTITARGAADPSVYLGEDSRVWYGQLPTLFSPALTLVDPNGYLIGEQVYERQSVYNFLGRTAISHFSRSGPTLCKMYRLLELSTGERINMVPCVFPLYDGAGTLLGYAVLYLPETQLHGSFQAFGDSVSILDSDNVILSAQDPKVLYKNYFEYHRINYAFLLHDTTVVTAVDGEDFILTTKTINSLGWQAVITKSAASSLSESNYNVRFFTLLFLVSFGLAAIVTFLISVFIGRPVAKLNESVERVKRGDLNERSAIRSKDEIGQLSGSINEMLDAIQTLMRRTEQTEREKRKTQMQLIQAQVKPHFLYNVLGIISGFLNDGETQLGNRAIDSLASFYRISLSDGSDVIPLSREVALVENYLTLQQLRYVDMIDYEIDIDESLEQACVPKLTLQPLVENAIDHGIRNTGRGGFIRISGREEDGFCVLTVRDNGAGMAPEKVSELNMAIESQTGDVHFGLTSVYRRLALCCGDQTQMMLSSQKEQGTVVTLRFPAQREKEES